MELLIQDQGADPRFVYDSYRRFLKEYGTTHYGIHPIDFVHIFEEVKSKVAQEKNKPVDEVTVNDDFDIKEFHSTLLGSGNVPLSMLDDMVQQWLNSKATKH